MSSAGANIPFPAEPAPAEHEPVVREPPRIYLSMVMRDAYRGWGARLATAWLGLLICFAVFAPLIANSRPGLLKTGGRWSSPLLEGLTPTDVQLLVCFFAAVVL